MKIRNLYKCLVFFVFLFSCSDENLPGPSSGEFLQKTLELETSNRIDMKEAASLIDSIVVFLDRKDPSKASSSRMVNSVSILRFSDNIKSSALKSGKYDDIAISDTLAYVFNFKDSLGFVIVSNDKRVDSPLLAFTEKGSLVNGETDNPGLILFLERLEGYMLESIIKSSKTDEQKLEVTPKGSSSSNVVREVKPLIAVEWGQQKPFSDNLGGQCEKTDNGKYPAGCVATATAQIMSYWQYPDLPITSLISWTRLNQYKHKDDFSSWYQAFNPLAKVAVAELFQRIGIGVKMNYRCTGSGTNTSLALDFLVSNGFTSSFSPVLVSYDLALVKSLLTSKRPIMAQGYDYTDGYMSGHAWVMDGFADVSPSSSNLITFTFIHNNWGWDGDGNGYFLSGIFNPRRLNNVEYNFEDIKIGSVYR